MEIIEVASGMAPGFGTAIVVIAIIGLVTVAACAVAYARSGNGDILGFGILYTILVGGFAALVVYLAFSGYVSDDETERIREQVSEVSGVELTTDDVDSMVSGEPVREVYYYKDGYTLVVEKG